MKISLEVYLKSKYEDCKASEAFLKDWIDEDERLDTKVHFITMGDPSVHLLENDKEVYAQYGEDINYLILKKEIIKVINNHI
tara:strand:+ start:60695 stop:60940 length:246 start_codon:yes stop_codon:yes gene_type:complete